METKVKVFLTNTHFLDDQVFNCPLNQILLARHGYHTDPFLVFAQSVGILIILDFDEGSSV